MDRAKAVLSKALKKELVDSAAVDSVGFLCAASSLKLAAARKNTGVFIPRLL